MSNVVITGGGSGIGLAIAQQFLASGSSVYVCDLNEQALNNAVKDNPGLRGATADVGDHEDVERFFHKVIDEFSNIDVLVNNVGIEGPHCPVEEISPEAWEQMININLSGMFHCARTVIPLMKQQRSGVILNISTASVKSKPTNRAGYIVSKSGVEALTKVLARELGPWNIRCNALQPGLINNERMNNIIARYARERNTTSEAILQGYLDYISMRTSIEMHEIGDTCVFLASNAAKNITSQIISVDGNIEWEK